MVEKKTPKISIIVPIYNVERFLHQALFSVANQTLRDLEIICVEDCSTDNSAKILKTFSDSDGKIKVIWHECNMGVSISRKEAVLASNGEYIMFLDGDDYLDTTACKTLYQMINREKADILQFGTTIVPQRDISKNELIALENLLKPSEERFFTEVAGELVDYCFFQKKFGFTLWNKIYRGDLVRQAISYYSSKRFDIAEDMYLFFLIAFFSKKYISTDKKFYFYNFGTGITGDTQISFGTFQKKIRQGEILKQLKLFAEKYDPAGITDKAIENISEQFISDVMYNFIWRSDNIERKELLREIFNLFDTDEILEELVNAYYTGDYNLQKNILTNCKEQVVFEANKKTIKTIGTFYHRIDNGGVERVLAKLISMWVDQGYKVILFTDELPSPTDYSYPQTVERIILPKIQERNKENYKKRIAYLRDMLQRYDVDVMVYHAWISEFLFLDMLATKSIGIPFIVHTHSFFAQGLKSKAIEDAYQTIMINEQYSLCDAIITLSDVDYNWWALRHNHVYKTINPLSFDLRKIVCASLNNRNILWIGRISPEKNPIDALKIMRTVIDLGCNAVLHVVGKADSEEYYKKFKQQIEILELDDYVVLHGFHKDVHEFYRNASVYLHTSEFEGFPMTFVESKAYGLPAVVYKIPNLDMIQNPQGMYVVEQNNVMEAAKKIVELLGDDSKRLSMGSEARDSVEQIYKVNVVNIWKNIFSNIEGSTHLNYRELEIDKLAIAVELLLCFSAKGLNDRKAERLYYQRQNRTLDIDSLLERNNQLEEIYGMRSWQLIQKYRNFMDNTKLGNILSSMRDRIFKRKRAEK